MPHDVEAARGADADFGARLTALVPNLRAFARTLCRGGDGAEDLAQETVLNAWKSRATFARGTNLKAWLFVIQRNAHRSIHRRKWREVAWDEEAMERRLVTAPAQHATAELAELARAMGRLPTDQREALVLVAAGGFSYHEAAALRGCPPGTMKSRVSRARLAVAALVEAGVASPRKIAGGAYESIVRELVGLSVPRQAA